MRNSLSEAHPFSKIIFATFIFLICLLLTYILGFLIAIPIFHIDITNINRVLSDYNDPNTIRFLKYLQTLQAFGLFIIPAFAFIFLGPLKPLLIISVYYLTKISLGEIQSSKIFGELLPVNFDSQNRI